VTPLDTSAWKEAAMPSINEKTAGFWIVLAGLVALVILVVAAIIRYPHPNEATGVITAVGTVLGTLVGAFFGVNAGAAGRQKAEAIKDQAMAGLTQTAAQAEKGSKAAEAAAAAAKAIKDAHLDQPGPGTVS
jgi:hypothetical protein